MGSTPDPSEGQPHGGRGARERIVRTAARLFYEEGVNATGVERLTEQAHVSKRTFYQHFPSKNALVQEYLRRFETDTPLRSVRALERADLAPRERLLAVFAEPPGSGRLRGCPFHNAAVETAGTLPEVEQAVIRHKQAFTRRLIDTAREAGAPPPDPRGRRRATLWGGAPALAPSPNAAAPTRAARAAAAALIDAPP